MNLVEELLGVRPPDPIPDKKGSKTGGLKFTWLHNHFHELPDGADGPTIERYARAYVLYVFGIVLFADSGGSSASWMFLPLLRDWDEAGRYSWGSAGLAFLYRQLDEACRRSSGTSNIGGCVLLFQIWMWERLPVGRPTSRTRRDWEYDEPDRLPTVTHCWDEVRTNWGKSEDLYMSYTNELDCLLPSHVSSQQDYFHQLFFILMCSFVFQVTKFNFDDRYNGCPTTRLTFNLMSCAPETNRCGV